MKAVVNKRYGGYSLSEEACRRLMARGYCSDANQSEEYWTYKFNDIPRHNADLVAIVEELGAAACGASARLEVVEFDGECYRIEELDGRETLITATAVAHARTTRSLRALAKQARLMRLALRLSEAERRMLRDVLEVTARLARCWALKITQCGMLVPSRRGQIGAALVTRGLLEWGWFEDEDNRDRYRERSGVKLTPAGLALARLLP